MMRRDVYQAIADPTRRAILSLIAIQALTPNVIADHFEVSRQAVSKHIKVLAECQLIHSSQNGREIYYSINPEKLKEIDQWLNQFRLLWDLRFSQLDKVLHQIKPTT